MKLTSALLSLSILAFTNVCFANSLAANLQLKCDYVITKSKVSEKLVANVFQKATGLEIASTESLDQTDLATVASLRLDRASTINSPYEVQLLHAAGLLLAEACDATESLVVGLKSEGYKSKHLSCGFLTLVDNNSGQAVVGKLGVQAKTNVFSTPKVKLVDTVSGLYGAQIQTLGLSLCNNVLAEISK